MPNLTINGHAVEVPPGTNLIEAARKIGVEIPHYCYHPGLSIAGQCRLCMVDIEKTPRPSIACNTVAADGMVVHTETERVKETRRSMMEFHLINHPLDCPVCDQAGECWLQIYYMKHGLYDPRMTDEKIHKPKALPLGPHVMLDAERCILCSRCVRFCDEITGTGELGIFNRGDHSEIGLFPGRDLENKYSGNVVDICPVGALTDRDFRFQVRVWYLDTTKSICPGCARGCNIDVHVNRKRPHHADGRRVARLKPRFNDAVNAWWICDVGRYGFGSVDDESRIRFARQRGQDLTRDDALGLVIAALRDHAPDEIAILASADLANEDLFALRRLAEHRGIRQVAFRVPPATRIRAAPRSSASTATRRRFSRAVGRARSRCSGSSATTSPPQAGLLGTWPTRSSTWAASSIPAPTTTGRAPSRRWCCRWPRGSSATGRSRTSSVVSNASARRWSRSATRSPVGICSAGFWARSAGPSPAAARSSGSASWRAPCPRSTGSAISRSATAAPCWPVPPRR